MDIKTKQFKAFHIIQNLLSPFFPLGFGRFQIICKVLVQQINKIRYNLHQLVNVYHWVQGRKLLFYDIKESLLRKTLDDTHQRNPDHPPPEIVIDPVEEIGNRSEDVCHCLFSQVGVGLIVRAIPN